MSWSIDSPCFALLWNFISIQRKLLMLKAFSFRIQKRTEWSVKRLKGKVNYVYYPNRFDYENCGKLPKIIIIIIFIETQLTVVYSYQAHSKQKKLMLCKKGNFFWLYFILQFYNSEKKMFEMMKSSDFYLVIQYFIHVFREFWNPKINWF